MRRDRAADGRPICTRIRSGGRCAGAYPLNPAVDAAHAVRISSRGRKRWTAMTDESITRGSDQQSGHPELLAILLAMAMFVLVVDTSLMNVSISSVVRDLDTTVSGVQSAIALEALVSAAFILIGSKIGDLIGRRRATCWGGCSVMRRGAAAMALAQSLTAVIVFWAVVGGIGGASLLLPAMQSLIHGNFEGGRAEEGLRTRRRGRRDSRGRRTAARRIHHHLPVLAPRVRARGGDHRRCALRYRTRPRRALHRIPRCRRGSVHSCPCSAWAASCWASWSGRKAAKRSQGCW